MNYMPYDARDSLKNKWANCNGEDKEIQMWKAWQNVYEDWRRAKAMEKKKFHYEHKDLSVEQLVLSYLYPRLDANVSTGINHLLKAPFCVHPKTGNICVPFDANKVENFKLSEVPTLTTVINELGESRQKQIPGGD